MRARNGLRGEWAAIVALLGLVGCGSGAGTSPTDGGGSPDAPAEGSNGGADVGAEADTGGPAGMGGMHANDGAAGTGGSPALDGGDGGPSCGVQELDPQRAAADLFVVLDRSASMQDGANGLPPTATNPSKWIEVTQALQKVIDASGDSFAWGLKAFPEGTGAGACAAATVTTRIDLPIATGNAAALTSAIARLAPDGDGTPTSAAIRVATDHLRALADGRTKYLLLVTDGEPGCAGSAGALVADLNQARSDAVVALSSAAQLGFHTFVIGVATSSATASATLNMMALAGQEPRRDPNPLAARYYAASTQSELEQALAAITGVVGACRFALAATPPAGADASVTVGGALAPRDPSRSNGWDYGIGGGGSRTIELYGAWCEALRSPAAPHVQIAYSCPDGGGGPADGHATGDAPPGTILLSDDFEDGIPDGWIPGTLGLPTTWQVVADGANLVFAQPDATLSPSRVAGGDRAWTDQAVSARVKFLTTPNQIQLAARFVDANNYYFLELSDGRIKIRKRSAQVVSDLATALGAAPLVTGTWYTIGLTVQGTSLTAYLNGTAVATATDSTPPTIDAGGIGLVTLSNAAAFDDIKVTVP